MSFLVELWTFMKVRKKILALPGYVHDGHFWWPISSQPGVSRGPFIYTIFLESGLA